MFTFSKKNYFVLIIGLFFILNSCSKIEPEKRVNKTPELNKIENTNSGVINSGSGNETESGVIKIGDNKIFLDSKACGEKTCAFQAYLEKQEFEGKFNLEKTQYFQERFKSLVTRFKQKDILVKAPEFQKFVDDFNSEYFPCEWKVEICNKKSKYSYDEQNFIWYIFMPKMVAIEYQEKMGGSDSDTEAIIQAIRRKYYATFDEKEAMIEVWKDKVNGIAKKIDLSVIDKKKLQTDKEYFKEIVLTPNTGIYDKIITNLLSPIPWQEQGELLETTNFGINLFLSKMKELGISKKYFYDNIGTSENNFKKLDELLINFDKKYSLTKVMPSDRYLRHDEIANYIFANIGDFNKKGDFNKDVLELKHYLLLQFAYPDPDLYNMPERAAKFNSVNNFFGENLLKYSKYMDKFKF
ncbi:hypothetical protein M0P65_03375 [Candidatus Gracilibacteria bacterium]|nr:hypothetical protein [Candidatus Gracilibacteria bacterium]